MSHPYDLVSNRTISEEPELFRRSPAIVITGTAALGIIADRVWPIPLDAWLLLSTLSAILWIYGFATRRRILSVACLLLGWFCLMSAWHHWRWNCQAINDIVNVTTSQPRLARVVGKVIQAPWVVRHAGADRARWQNPEQTILFLECRSLISPGAETMLAAGKARVSVNGTVPSLALGDVIEVTGELLRPHEPSNPGDFDQRSFLRTQGVSTVIRADFADGIRIVSRERTLWDWLLVIRGGLRSRADRLIENWLGEETAPVAQAMLLGSRVQIDDDTRRAFRESGMLHILAISGMNVGLLWSWIWTLSRWLGRSAESSTWIVLFALPFYAIITDANPPIVRATVVAVVVAFGRLLGRQGAIGNSLALAGLAVLVWNPSDLFNTGAQLSFLAVFAILHATNWLAQVRRQTSAQSDDAPVNPTFVQRWSPRILRAIFESVLVGLAVWTLTSPLVANQFHLVSPIGSILTVLLVVPVTIMFWIGYSFLLLGLVWSSAFGWLGMLFDFCLRGFLWTVRAGASLDLGHVYVPAPPIWWTAGFYAPTVLPILIARRGKWGAAVSVRAGLAWITIGLAWDLTRSPRDGLTCTFVSVGHGLSVLIECPNGRTVLYDAGGMIGGGSISRTISHALWKAGRSRLDALVISHADGDHCNAVPELTRVIAPSELFVHRSFLDWKQQPVAAAIEESSKVGTKIRLTSAGQSLVFDPRVAVTVLHPPHDFQSTRDNPNSLVLSIEYAGRRIVLTGDLELEGLERLLATPPLDADVLLSPHHGSLKANPTDLARWATPEYVVVSTSESKMTDRLAASYGPETQVLTTAACGAIRCRIGSDGKLTVEPFKKR